MTQPWALRRCLVTGAAGFGGTHLLRRLCELGASVIALDWHHPPSGPLAVTSSRLSWITADIRDSARLRQLMQAYELDTVFHLAAQPLVRVSNVLPDETISINVEGTVSVLEAMRVAAPQATLIFASSGAYYGNFPPGEPVVESTPSSVSNNIYSASKASADLIVRSYASIYGTKAVCCRFMNTFGPGDANVSRLIPGAIKRLLNEEPYDFGESDDGTTALTYMYIGDMTEAYLRAAEHIDSCAGEAFNFGALETISTSDVARAVSRAFDGVQREPVFRGPHREQQITKQLDVTKARRELGWEPKTSFDDGLRRTCAWYKEQWGCH